jgi:PTH2 family peptidyl-tRNA hydrolase
MLEGLWRLLMSRDFLIGLITGLSSAIVIRNLFPKQVIRTVASKKSVPVTATRKYTGGEEAKMVILVRQDLNMGKGKAAAQACHAVLAAYKDAQRRDPSVLEAWETSGQAKVTLKVESEEEMMTLVKKAREYGVTAQYIRDAGRTQLAPNTTTVAAIGPAPKTLLDLVTGHLKLY